MTDKPTEHNPAEELRAAAAELRAFAKRVPTDMDGKSGDYYRSRFDHADLHPGDVAWIGLVHPGLAEPLAAWLEGQATRHDEINCLWCAPVNVPNPVGPCAEMADALAVARVLNGGAA